MFAAGLILVIFVLCVFILKQTLPVPAREALENPLAPTTLFLLAAIGELCLMPAALGLYLALKDVKKTPMFIATGLWLVAVPMFLASRGLIISLSQLSGRYMHTADATMKAAYLASAELALETQNIYAMMGLLRLKVWLISAPLLLYLASSTFGGFMSKIHIPGNNVPEQYVDVRQKTGFRRDFS